MPAQKISQLEGGEEEEEEGESHGKSKEKYFMVT